MSYHENFEPPEVYFSRINKLIEAYKSRGFVVSVNDWEKMVSMISDYPDLKRLSSKAEFLYVKMIDRETKGR